jgi:hypothetical protein
VSDDLLYRQMRFLQSILARSGPSGVLMVSDAEFDRLAAEARALDIPFAYEPTTRPQGETDEDTA